MDQNQNGLQDNNEAGISKVRLILRPDADSDARAGGTDDIYALTEHDGGYEFVGLPPSTYLIIEDDPAGFFSTTPNEVRINGAPPTSDIATDFGDCPYWYTYLPILTKRQ
jgi:hypothetical protein